MEKEEELKKVEKMMRGITNEVKKDLEKRKVEMKNNISSSEITDDDKICCIRILCFFALVLILVLIIVFKKANK